MSETAYREFLAEHGFTTSSASYRVNNAAGYLEYEMIIRSRDSGAERRLAAAIGQNTDILEFSLIPASD